MAFNVGDKVIIVNPTSDLYGEKAEVVYPLKSGRYFVIADGYSTVKGQRVIAERSLELDVPEPPPPPPPPPAEWYVRPDGDDFADGRSVATAFRSFSRAYEAAGEGDDVVVQPGRYPRQVLTRRSEKDAFVEPVLFTAAGQPGVVVDGLAFGNIYDSLGAHNVAVAGIEIDGWLDLRRVENVTFLNTKIRGGIHVAGADKLSFIGGEWGPQANPDGGHPEFTAWRGSVPVTNLLVDGVKIHHIGRPPRSQWGSVEPHTNALHIWGSGHRDITIRGCTFEYNDVFHILLGGDPGGIQNVLLEDNTFYAVTDAGFVGTGYYSVKVEGVDGFTARRNAFLANPPSLRGDVTGVVACGNTGQVVGSWSAPCA